MRELTVRLDEFDLLEISGFTAGPASIDVTIGYDADNLEIRTVAIVYSKAGAGEHVARAPADLERSLIRRLYASACIMEHLDEQAHADAASARDEAGEARWRLRREEAAL